MFLNNQLNNIIFKKQHKRLLDESLLDVRQKNASNLSDEEFKQLMSYDPIISQIDNLDDATMASTNESFSRWLLKMFKNGSLQNAEPEQVRKLLQDFEIAKKRRNLLPNNDINSYKKIDDLKDALDNAHRNLTINQKNKDARKAQSTFNQKLKPGIYLNGGAELLYTNDNWEVWTPHSYEGSKALRHGACWCTGGDTPSFYNSYTNDGQLYIIINKNDKNEKYQLFVPFANQYTDHQKEFRDKDNESLKFREFVHNNDLVDFFITQDNVTNSYENLEDPYIDDEWDDEKEDEIAYQYDLGYDDYTGEVCIYISYSDLVRSTNYTSDDDYQDYASHGYLENGIQGDYNRYISDVIGEDEFISNVDWESTDLMELYKFFKKDSVLTEYTFEDFINTLFEGASHYNGNHYIKQEIFDWLNNREYGWEQKVRDSISQSYLDEPYTSFIYNALQKNGWNPPSPNYNSYSYNRDNRYENYLESFSNSFKYVIDDCHSIQQFWEEYTDRGDKDLSDVIDDLGIGIYERDGDIDTSDCDWGTYSSDYASDDAKSIVDIFMSKQEWNDFISSTENSNENNDTENTKLYNGVKCSINNNYYVFHDEGALFYVPKKEIEENIDYYNRWGELRLGGLPFEIIREQISKYPESYIREILLKYGGLDDKQKEFYEKNTIRTDDLNYHLTNFIENTIEDYVKKHSDKKEVDESLFEPDW